MILRAASAAFIENLTFWSQEQVGLMLRFRRQIIGSVLFKRCQARGMQKRKPRLRLSGRTKAFEGLRASFDMT